MRSVAVHYVQLWGQCGWQGMRSVAVHYVQLWGQCGWQGTRSVAVHYVQLWGQCGWQGMRSVAVHYVQLWGQCGWQGMRSVAVHCLHQFLAAMLVSHQSFACGIDHISQLGIMLWKTMQKTGHFFVVVMIVVNQFLPLALSQLTISRLLKVNKPARNLQIPAEV